MNSIVRSLDIDRAVAPAAFTDAMRNLAGGVSILTVGRGSDITGMTVTSVTSLSIDPPTLLVSVNRNASSWPALQGYGAFGVNIVGAHQIAIAERFSGKGGLKGAERFVGANWRTGATGVPLLADAAAAFECTVEETIERHSHAIVIGRVTGLRSSVGNAGLAYWNGGYVEVDQDGDSIGLLDKGVPGARALREI